MRRAPCPPLVRRFCETANGERQNTFGTAACGAKSRAGFPVGIRTVRPGHSCCSSRVSWQRLARQPVEASGHALLLCGRKKRAGMLLNGDARVGRGPEAQLEPCSERKLAGFRPRKIFKPGPNTEESAGLRLHSTPSGSIRPRPARFAQLERCSAQLERCSAQNERHSIGSDKSCLAEPVSASYHSRTCEASRVFFVSRVPRTFLFDLRANGERLLE